MITSRPETAEVDLVDHGSAVGSRYLPAEPSYEVAAELITRGLRGITMVYDLTARDQHMFRVLMSLVNQPLFLRFPIN